MLLVPFGAHSSDWAHDAISLTHKYGDGSGVKVGVMDGVARCSHQELAGHCVNILAEGSVGTIANHATHISTIIAGKDKAPSWIEHGGGVAPNAKIYSYEVFSGGEHWISDENEVNMANRAASDGVSVINMSYGAYNDYGRAYLSEALLNVWRSHQNIIFVNAAGNEGTVLDPGNHGNIDNVIFVGASDESGRIAGWSNRPGENYKNQFIVAPGDFISGGFAGNDADYGWMSGTSMAAPMVTGAIAILHDHWGHLKGNPVATAGIIFDSAIDKGAPGVDAVYGHGMLNVLGMFEPIPIKDNPAEDDCDDVIVIDEPYTPPGSYLIPPGGEWYDSRGRRHQKQCADDDPTVEEPVVDYPDDPVVEKPGDDHCKGGYLTCDGHWFDSRGDRNYFAIETNGQRRVLERVQASSALIRSASNLSVVFFDKYGRDYKTRAARYNSTSQVKTDFIDLNDMMAIQLVSGHTPNVKFQFDDVAIGTGRTLGFANNPVLAMLDDGVFVKNDKVGVMYSDTSTTALYQPEDWLTMTYTKEDGFLGSTGLGKYDTISTTVSKDYGMFFGSTTMAVSKGGNDRGMVKMSDTVSSMAFEAGLKGQTSKNWNWMFTVSQALQPVDGTMSVSYDNRYGRNITNSVDLGDYRDTQLGFKISYTW